MLGVSPDLSSKSCTTQVVAWAHGIIQIKLDLSAQVHHNRNFFSAEFPCDLTPGIGESLRESLWEGTLPLRGSLRGKFSEVFRGFQRFSEGFQRFWEVFLFRDFSEFLKGFQRSSERPSQRQIALSEALSPVAPNCVAPWTFSNGKDNRCDCDLRFWCVQNWVC